jgi:hypothetical protein
MLAVAVAVNTQVELLVQVVLVVLAVAVQDKPSILVAILLVEMAPQTRVAVVDQALLLVSHLMTALIKAAMVVQELLLFATQGLHKKQLVEL